MEVHDPILADLGWNSFFSTQVSIEEAQQCRPVRVMAVHRGKIAVAGAGLECLIPSRLPASQGEEDRPTVGDWLLITRSSLEALRILNRASLFKRRAPGGDGRLQLVAA